MTKAKMRAKEYAISKVGKKVAESRKELMWQMLYDAGYSIDEIAGDYKAKTEEVKKYISTMTIEESTYKLYKRGWTLEALAGLGRVDVETVVKRLLDYTTKSNDYVVNQGINGQRKGRNISNTSGFSGLGIAAKTAFV